MKNWLLLLLFFSALATKRNVYVLGAVPAVAILIGSVWSELDKGTFRWARFARAAYIILLLVAGIGVLGASFWPGLPIAGWPLWPVGLIALAGGVALWSEVRCVNPPTFFLLAALVWLTVEWTVGVFVYPAINPLKTPVALTQIVQERLPSDRPLLLYAMNDEILTYHSNRRGEVLRTPEALSAAMQRERCGLVVFHKRTFDAWPADALPLVGETGEFRSGSKRYVWLAFDFQEARDQSNQDISILPP